MGVDHGGTGDKSPQNLERGDANTNYPPRFCHIGTKMSVQWNSKYAKMRFRPGLRPGSRWGSSRRSPDLSRLERGHPSPYATPLDTRTHLRCSPCVPPEVQPDLRLCLHVLCCSLMTLRAWVTFRCTYAHHILRCTTRNV